MCDHGHSFQCSQAWNQTGRIEIKISCNLDPSVLFEVKRPESHTSISNITTEVKIKGNVTDEQLKTVERLVHHSPVFGLIEYAHKIETSVGRA